MKRREFIKAGAATATVAGLAGAAGAVGFSCANLGLDSLLTDVGPQLPDMRPYLERFDRGMERLSDWSLSEVSEREAIPAAEDELARRAIRSLYVTAMFGDLPDAGQVHPGMQARVERALPEMNDAVMGMCDYLESRTPEQADDLRRWLERSDNPGMALAERLDVLAVETGMSASRRTQTRSMMTQLTSRMRNQPPRLAFDEYVGKTRRLASRAGSVEQVQRLMMAQMGERAFWEQQQRLALLSARWQDEGDLSAEVPLPPPELEESADAGVETNAGVAVDEEPAPVPAPGPEMVELTPAELEEVLRKAEQEARREVNDQAIVDERENLRTRAGWTLGIGAVTIAAGTAVMVIPTIGTAIVGMNLLTAGAVLLIIGIASAAAAKEPE